jgi:serine protease Do
MLKRILLAISLCVMPLLVQAAPASFAPIAKEHSGAVVNISTVVKAKEVEGQMPFEGMGADPFQGTPFEGFFGDIFGGFPQMPSIPSESLGSGLVISADGYIVTNYHVVEGADEIVVRFTEAEQGELDAEIVGHDKKNDIALLKVEPKNKLAFAPLNKESKVEVGDWVLAIGNPFGLGGSVSAGIVSAMGRNIGLGPYDHFIQTDAAINPGNSGGPLFNMSGEVVGINTAILSRTGGSNGIGFSIPTETVAMIVEQLKEFGRPVRGWLGVKIQTITPDLAEAMNLQDESGALVAAVEKGSPARKAGIRDGDVILKFDGIKINTMDELPKIVAETAIGKRVPVEVMRGKRTMILQVVIAELDEEEIAQTNSKPAVQEKPFGLVLGDLTDYKRDEYQVDASVKGVLVEKVVPGSSAYRARVRPGDVVMQVAQKTVTGSGEAVRLLKKHANKPVLLLINRRGDTLFVALKAEK